MTARLPGTAPDSRPWYREPWVWFVIALPAVAVVAGLVTLGLAIHGSDEVVRDDFRSEGLSIHPDPRRDAAAAALAARAELAIDASGRVEVALALARGPTPGGLQLLLSHATRSELDRLVHLERHDAAWAGQVGALPDGHWYVEITPTDRAWRLTGEFRGAQARLVLRPAGAP